MSEAIDTISGPGRDRIIRFDRAERWLHGVNALLVLIIMTTGAVLYFGPLSGIVGRRVLMRNIHVYCGLLLPFPFLVTLAGRWRRGFRRDVARLGRWTRNDTRWVRSRGHEGAQLGKFNAGQKLNSILMAGVLPVLLVTGAILHWFSPFSDSMRTGAEYVHDLGAFAVWIAVTGHILKAVNEPEQLQSMRTGWVPRDWAKRHRPRWHDVVVAADEARSQSIDVHSE